MKKCLSLLAVVFFSLGFAFGHGGDIEPQPKTIVYKDISSKKEAVRAAQIFWSRQIGVRWREASYGETVDLVLYDSSSADLSKMCQERCIGWSTTLGNTPGSSAIFLDEGAGPKQSVPLVIHEMGHFFGLPHEDNGSIMRARGVTISRCFPVSWHCSLSPEAIENLHNLYRF